MPNAFPPITLPPPKSKAGTSQQAVYKAYINAHPTMRAYANGIYRNALAYGIDPVYFASLLWTESFSVAKARGVDPTTIKSSAGAIGLGQIMPFACW